MSQLISSSVHRNSLQIFSIIVLMCSINVKFISKNQYQIEVLFLIVTFKIIRSSLRILCNRWYESLQVTFGRTRHRYRDVAVRKLSYFKNLYKQISLQFEQQFIKSLIDPDGSLLYIDDYISWFHKSFISLGDRLICNNMKLYKFMKMGLTRAMCSKHITKFTHSHTDLLGLAAFN